MSKSRFKRYSKGDYIGVCSIDEISNTNCKTEVELTQHAYKCSRCKTWQDWVSKSLNLEEKMKILEDGHSIEACDLVIIRQIHES